MSDPIGRDSFKDDESVGFAAVERDIPTEDAPAAEWVFVPKRNFDRLLDLGRTHHLHFASLLDAEMDAELNSTQCEGVLEELLVLYGLVDDPALASVIREVIRLVEDVVRYSGLSLRCAPP